MNLFDILIIVSVVIASLVTIGIVYWKFFMTDNYSFDDYDEMKNNIYSIAYNIKKNLIDSIDEGDSLPTEYNNILNEISRKYAKNCDLIKKMSEEEINKNKISELMRKNKKILKVLLSFEKASMSQQKFNDLIYKKFLDKLKKI